MNKASISLFTRTLVLLSSFAFLGIPRKTIFKMKINEMNSQYNYIYMTPTYAKWLFVPKTHLISDSSVHSSILWILYKKQVQGLNSTFDCLKGLFVCVIISLMLTK